MIESNDLYWCSEGCGFVAKDHRCEQWSNVLHIPREAIIKIEALVRAEHPILEWHDAKLVKPNDDRWVLCRYSRHPFTARYYLGVWYDENQLHRDPLWWTEIVPFGPSDRPELARTIAEGLAAHGYLAAPDDIERVVYLVGMVDTAEQRKGE